MLLAIRGGEESLSALRTQADAGDEIVQEDLAELLIRRGSEESLTELRAHASAGDEPARVAWMMCRHLADTARSERYSLSAQRERSPERHVLEFDCDGNSICRDALALTLSRAPGFTPP